MTTPKLAVLVAAVLFPLPAPSLAGTRVPSAIAATGDMLAATLHAEGAQIYDRWFVQKIPPKGLNLNTPMVAELKHEFAKPSDSPDPDSYK